MITIPFTKAHGAENDFLLSWADELPPMVEAELVTTAIAVCARHTGIGADGWMIVGSPITPGANASIRLFNADGSVSEMSGNGTRCAAAWLVDTGRADEEVVLDTGAGRKRLRLLGRNEREMRLEMEMGAVTVEALEEAFAWEGRKFSATILRVGNPQCAVFVEDFDWDWEALGAQLERLPRFPQRTNVSFVRVVDRGRVEVRFFERGVGVTRSSGTGSTGAATAAMARNLVQSPVAIDTPAGQLSLRMEGDVPVLTGPAVIIGSGEFRLARS